MSSFSELLYPTNKDTNKILWTSNTAWHSWTNQLGYPRLQGNIPMLNTLTSEKQNSLLKAYFSVYGNSVDHVNQEWKPY